MDRDLSPAEKGHGIRGENRTNVRRALFHQQIQEDALRSGPRPAFPEDPCEIHVARPSRRDNSPGFSPAILGSCELFGRRVDKAVGLRSGTVRENAKGAHRHDKLHFLRPTREISSVVLFGPDDKTVGFGAIRVRENAARTRALRVLGGVPYEWRLSDQRVQGQNDKTVGNQHRLLQENVQRA